MDLRQGCDSLACERAQPCAQTHLCEMEGSLEGNGNVRQGGGGEAGKENAWGTQICFLKIILMIHVLNYIPMPTRHEGTPFEKSNK